MLHLNSTKRLSIDIDIIMNEKPGDLNEVFNGVVEEQGFVIYTSQIDTPKSRQGHKRRDASPKIKEHSEEI